MKNALTRRMAASGFPSWLRLLALSFLLFDKNGQRLIAQPLFKLNSSMVIDAATVSRGLMLA
jgi:hypothetical protein